MKIKFGKNPNIKKAGYTDIDEFAFDKKTDVVPKTKSRLLCIMFSEEKGAFFLYRDLNSKHGYDCFRFHKGLYVIDSEAIHIAGNGARVAFYLEGISTPIKMSNVERETKEVTYKDLQGVERKTTIDKIKGLKFDARILDIFANRRFAEIFTKQPVNSFQAFLLIIGIVTIVMVGIGYGVTYMLR